MRKPPRITPYTQKARGGKKEGEKMDEIERAKIDAAKNIERIKVMTEEELGEIKKTVAQNALGLFNKLLEEMQRRIPQMTDDTLSMSLLAVWDKSGGARK